MYSSFTNANTFQIKKKKKALNDPLSSFIQYFTLWFINIKETPALKNNYCYPTITSNSGHVIET